VAEGRSEPFDFFSPPYSDGRVIYGFENISGHGNEWKFKQYHTPLSRPVLRLFEWQTGGPDGTFIVDATQPGWTDQGGRVEYRHGGGSLTRVMFGTATAEFHPALTIQSVDRLDNRTQATWQASPNGARIGLYFRGQDLHRDPKLVYPDYHSDESLARLTVPNGRWSFDFGDAQRRVRDRNDAPVRLNARSDSASVSYAAGSRSSVRISATSLKANTSPHGATALLESKGTVLALDAVAVPAPRLTLRGKLRRSRYSRTFTGVGYQQGDSGGGADLKYLVNRQWVMRAGWQSREVRFKNRSNRTDKPRINSSWIGAAFRPAKSWELWGNWSEARISGDPMRVPTLPDGTPILQTQTDGTVTGSLLPLAPDRLQKSEVRLSAPLPHYGGLTAGWSLEKRENRIRTLRYDLRREDLTFWLPLTPGWTLTGTATSDKLSGSQDYLQPWLSNTSTVSGSVTGPIGGNLTLSLLAMRYKVTGGFPARSSWYALAARRRVTATTDAEIRVQREYFTDDVTPRNSYRATSLVLEGRTRF
jgi:hypothetical protein